MDVDPARPRQAVGLRRHVQGRGKVYLHAAVSCLDLHVSGLLFVSRQPEAAVVVLHNGMLLINRILDLPVKAVLTDIDREFYGTETLPSFGFRLIDSRRQGLPA